MIRHPTVLVLGAGASAPYGFPLGISLVDKAQKETGRTGHGRIGSRLEQLGHSAAAIHSFFSALQGARPYSLDAFLETRREYLQIGKRVIADILLRAERNSIIGSAPFEVDWYRYLFAKILLLRNVEYYSQQAKLLTVVTFNFDRSFEFSLFLTLQNTIGLPLDEAAKRVGELRVHHVHGLLGAPDWVEPPSHRNVAYGIDISDPRYSSALSVAADQINIVHEEIANSQVLVDVQAALRQAKYVYFLGFGFDERNLSKLDTPNSTRGADRVIGTVLNWSKAERGPLDRHFDGQPNVEFFEQDAISLVKEHASSLFL